MFFSFKKFVYFLTLALFLVCLFQYSDVWSRNKNYPLEIVFLNIGQGDAILINYLNRYQVLIDGGPSNKKLMHELGEAMPKNDREIETVILSHPDADHFGGLNGLLDYYSVKSFLTIPFGNEKENYNKLIEELNKKNIPIRFPEIGSSMSFGEYLDFEFLWPDSDYFMEDINERSIVVKMNFGENSFLFTGDIGFEAEDFLVKRKSSLIDADWLKIAHHGSKNSSSEEFLKKVSPNFSIISVGEENRYGHPAEETLLRIKKVDSEILRTDKDGVIFVGCKNYKKESCFVY